MFSISLWEPFCYLLAMHTYRESLTFCLPSDDPATWAGLMAACHTENTSCYLSVSAAPRRRGLEQTLMSVVSEKGVCFHQIPCFAYVFEHTTDTRLYPSTQCRGDRAPSSPVSRRLGTTTGSDWSHAGGTARTGRSPLLTGRRWLHLRSILIYHLFIAEITYYRPGSTWMMHS